MPQWFNSLLFFVGRIALAKALPGSTSRNLRLETTAFSGFQIERVLFGVGDDSFAGNLSFKSSNRALYTLVIVNLNLCH